MRARARQTIAAKYDCVTACPPHQIRIIDGLTGRTGPVMTPVPAAPARQIRLTATEAEVLDRLRQGMSGVGSGPPVFLK